MGLFWAPGFGFGDERDYVANGYWGGWWEGFKEGWGDGCVIAGNRLLFGLNDDLNDLAQQKICEYGTIGKASDIAAGIGRDALISAAGLRGVQGLHNLRYASSNQLVPVSQWPSGINSNWVMQGGPNRWNYFWSGKWQPGFGNQYAPFSSGGTFSVPASVLKYPNTFFGPVKGVLGQRIIMF